MKNMAHCLEQFITVEWNFSRRNHLLEPISLALVGYAKLVSLGSRYTRARLTSLTQNATKEFQKILI